MRKRRVCDDERQREYNNRLEMDIEEKRRKEKKRIGGKVVKERIYECKSKN